MKQINVWLPLMDVRALMEKRTSLLAFTTDEFGEPMRVEIRIREHHQPHGVEKALGRTPREA